MGKRSERCNATGVNVLAADLGPKRLGLLHEVVPNANSIALLVNPTNPVTTMQITQMEQGARAIGVQLQIFKASRKDEFVAAFGDLVRTHVDALVIAVELVATIIECRVGSRLDG